MNIAFDPWIPVVARSGVPELASLCSVLTEGERYADLAVRPHERVSLMRLFLCVAHAALEGPRDYEEYLEVPQKLPDSARSYLESWRDSFELFHETRPWLQIKDLEAAGNSGKTSPVTLLDFELATGNNTTLLDHQGGMKLRVVDPPRLALNLLTFQNFSSGGGSPIAQWKSVKTSQVGNPDAPCLSQSMIHCLFRGATLFETVHLNLPTLETIERKYKTFKDTKKVFEINNVGSGRPVWEMFPGLPKKESDEVINATTTYIGRLVPISRWIRLIKDSDQMYCCNGFKYDTFKDGFASEPTASVYVVRGKDNKGNMKSERRVVKADPMKALWRELPALLTKRTAFGVGGPLAIENVPHDKESDFLVCAMIRDQASMDIAIESVFHITPALYAYLSNYQEEVFGSEKFIGAEGVASKLRSAVEKYREEEDGYWKRRIENTEAKKRGGLKNKLAETALLSYWTTVEKNLVLLMKHIESIGYENAISTRDVWRKMLFTTACDAYRVACGQETPRQMKAFSKGWGVLSDGKKTKLSEKTVKEVSL